MEGVVDLSATNVGQVQEPVVELADSTLTISPLGDSSKPAWAPEDRFEISCEPPWPLEQHLRPRLTRGLMSRGLRPMDLVTTSDGHIRTVVFQAHPGLELVRPARDGEMLSPAESAEQAIRFVDRLRRSPDSFVQSA